MSEVDAVYNEYMDDFTAAFTDFQSEWPFITNGSELVQTSEALTALWSNRGCIRCYYARYAVYELHLPKVGRVGDQPKFFNPEIIKWWKYWHREWMDKGTRRGDRYYCRPHTKPSYGGAAISKFHDLEAGHFGWICRCQRTTGILMMRKNNG